MKLCLCHSAAGEPVLVYLFFLFSFLSFLSTQTFIVEYLVEYSTLKVWFQYFSIILFTCIDTLYFILDRI